MLISVERVDVGINSIEVGKSIFDTKAMTRIDKLSFVTILETRKQRDTVVKRIKSLSSDDCDYTINYSKPTKQYQFAIRIRVPCQHGYAYVRIEYAPTIKDRAFIRFDLSPQRFKKHDIDKFFMWFFNKIGDSSFIILRHSFVTRIDFAVDINDHIMDRILINLDGARKGEITTTETIGGLRIGRPKSNSYLVVYEKINFLGAYLPKADDRGMMDFDISECEKFTRIEFRSKPKSKSVKLSNLNIIDNLTLDLRIYDKEKVVNYSKLPRLVNIKKTLETKTVPEAFQLLSGSDKQSRNRREKLNNILTNYKIELFDKNKIWEFWPQNIDSLGILAQPKLWNRQGMMKFKKLTMANIV